MAKRLEERPLRKPSALPVGLLALSYYMQIRHIYQSSGLWNPALGEEPRPVFHSDRGRMYNLLTQPQELRIL